MDAMRWSRPNSTDLSPGAQPATDWGSDLRWQTQKLHIADPIVPDGQSKQRITGSLDHPPPGDTKRC